jgi:hypothetical protein
VNHDGDKRSEPVKNVTMSIGDVEVLVIAPVTDKTLRDIAAIDGRLRVADARGCFAVSRMEGDGDPSLVHARPEGVEGTVGYLSDRARGGELERDAGE